jgi:predicted nucleotidyltransferase
MTDTSDCVLGAIVEVVLGHCDPDEIVLFGSWAKGTTHRYSDVDLLVIGTFRESSWLRDRELREAFREFPIAVDLHLLTAQELAVGSARAHAYLNTLLPTSRCLYRRPS